MNFDEAVGIFRDAGMSVQVGKGARQVTCYADASEPAAELRAQGVDTVYAFGFSLRQIETTWFLSVSPPKPAEQFERLEDAVGRALELFRSYRAQHSSPEYCDQVASFNADSDPCLAVERALVAEGWLESREHLTALGLSFLNGGSFSVHFRDQKRVVTVSVSPRAPKGWSLRVGTRRARYDASGAIQPIVVRRDRSGRIVRDPLARRLTYRVASVVHAAVAPVASNLRWALHSEPVDASGAPEPLAPSSD